MQCLSVNPKPQIISPPYCPSRPAPMIPFGNLELVFYVYESISVL